MLKPMTSQVSRSHKWLLAMLVLDPTAALADRREPLPLAEVQEMLSSSSLAAACQLGPVSVEGEGLAQTLSFKILRGGATISAVLHADYKPGTTWTRASGVNDQGVPYWRFAYSNAIAASGQLSSLAWQVEGSDVTTTEFTAGTVRGDRAVALNCTP